ncbi:MAG: ribonuclease Z [Nanobdellota archaeon]
MGKIRGTVLGTASMIPTKERNLTSILLEYADKGILFDCGEGTQRQMKYAGIKPNKVSKILISHWHGDHVLGLPGLLQTIGNTDSEKRIEIYGPRGSKRFFENMLKGFIYDTELEIEIIECTDGVIYEDDSFTIEARELSHGTRCMGYAFREKDARRMKKEKIEGLPGPIVGQLQNGQEVKHEGKNIKPNDVSYMEKGKKVSFVFDTEPCDNALNLAREADVLLCEATFLEELSDKGREFKHMTAKQAGLLASNGDAGRLILCHFSGRYKTTEALEEEAKDVFPDSKCAYDLFRFNV